MQLVEGCRGAIVIYFATVTLLGTMPGHSHFVSQSPGRPSSDWRQSTTSGLRDANGAEHASIRRSYRSSETGFEANHGQFGRGPKFIARLTHYDVSLSPNEAVFSVMKDCGRPTFADIQFEDVQGRDTPQPQSTLRMQFLGADFNSELEGCDELPGKSNYFIGDDPSKWRSNIPSYRKLVCRGV